MWSFGTGVHGRNKHKARRKGERAVGAADGDDPIFQPLAQRLQVAAAEFR